MSNETMTAADEAELNRLLQLDSADIPGAGAGVNRDSKDPSHTAPRSQYFGVYHNTGTNADKFKYRSALRVSNKGEKPRYMNLGYFDCEIVAAMAYNVAAVNMFGKGAWLNPVQTEAADVNELARFQKLRHEHITTAKTRLSELESKGTLPRYVNLDERQAEITSVSK